MPYNPDELIFFNMGLGQDSAAIAVLYCEGRLPAEYYTRRPYFVFADTGAELPETYDWMHQHFIPYLRRHGLVLHVLYPGGRFHRRKTGRIYRDIRTEFMEAPVPSFPTLSSPRCTEHSKQLPLASFREFMRQRWCGRSALQQTLAGFQDRVVIGIAADETHRAVPAGAKNYECWYPLIGLGLDRAGCREVIQAAGLAVPMKSGCYLCPFAPPWHYYWLLRKHPATFRLVEEMERLAIADRLSRGLEPNFILHKLGPVRRAALAWHDKHPAVSVAEIEDWMYNKDAYAVHHGRKPA